MYLKRVDFEFLNLNLNLDFAEISGLNDMDGGRKREDFGESDNGVSLSWDGKDVVALLGDGIQAA